MVFFRVNFEMEKKSLQFVQLSTLTHSMMNFNCIQAATAAFLTVAERWLSPLHLRLYCHRFVDAAAKRAKKNGPNKFSGYKNRQFWLLTTDQKKKCVGNLLRLLAGVRRRTYGVTAHSADAMYFFRVFRCCFSCFPIWSLARMRVAQRL